MFKSVLAILLCLIPNIVGAELFSTTSIGFGVQRLKKFRGKHLLGGEGNVTTCENVEQYWFKGAVVDNFASIEDQTNWAGDGQRYWMNKQFWRCVCYSLAEL